MQQWLAWLVIAACGVACAQEGDVDANEKILRALRAFNKAQVLYRSLAEATLVAWSNSGHHRRALDHPLRQQT